jgi:hypothetical protein
MNGALRAMKQPSLALAATALFAPLARAHEGHGLEGAHWHASDTWGFVALGVVLLVAWLLKGGR